jgi:hypothetical protein
MNSQITYRRNGNPKLGNIKQVMRGMENEGEMPNLYAMELAGWVTYNPPDGTYRLTEKGKQKLLREKKS